MSDTVKQNDWIVATLENPTRTPGDFRVFGMNLDNTQLLSKDRYLKSDFIRQNDAFKNEDGEFSETKFTEFYNNVALPKFQTFANIDDDFQYDLFDFRQYNVNDAIQKPFDINVFRQTNPTETTIGAGFINEKVESPFSDRERAQQNLVFDSATGKYLDYSPNDHTLVNSPLKWFTDLFSEPLVLATYDEDGVDYDPFTGIPFDVKKGQPKMNKDGKYYYETLNGRSLANKQVLSSWDLLTKDGTAVNSIDFMDSDDREKSITGSIIKNAIAVAPLVFASPEIAAVYGASLITREVLKALPQIDGYVSMVTGDNSSTSLERMTNNIAGWAGKFSTTTSDYSQNKQFTFENIATLMSEVALQWKQQKLIAQQIAKLSNTTKLAESAEASAFNLWKEQAPKLAAEQKALGKTPEFIAQQFGDIDTWKDSFLGQKLLSDAMYGIPQKIQAARELGGKASLMYMALVSNTDVYQQMMEHGVTKREAALVTLGSTLGMFYVDNSLHLGQAFFDELQNPAKLSVNNTLTKEKSKWTEAFAKFIKNTPDSKNKALKILSTAIDSSKKFYNKYRNNLADHTLGFVGKAYTEGLEEVMEEVAADLSKQGYQWLSNIDALNLTTNDVGAWGYDKNNPEWLVQTLGRYGMNFLGGFLGGGLFYGVDLYNGNLPKRIDTNDNLLYNVKEYGVDRVLKTLDDMHKKGKLASTKFSTVVANGNTDDETIFLPADENNISQNDYVYQVLKNEILSIAEVLKDNTEITGSDALLFKMTKGEARLYHLAQETKNDFSKGMIDRWNDLTDNYINVVNTIKKMQAEATDSEKRHSTSYEERLQQLEARRDELKQQIHDFTSSENAIDYTQSLLFNLDSRVSEAFYSPTFDIWLKHFHRETEDGTVLTPMTMDDYNKLSDADKHILNEKYLAYRKGAQDQQREQAWAAFKQFSKDLMPEIQAMQESAPSKRSYLKSINEIFGENGVFANIKTVNIDDITVDNPDESMRYNYDDHLEGETPEDYNMRNQKKDSESKEDFEKRKNDRIQRLKAEKAQKIYEDNVYEALGKVEDIVKNVGSILDPSTKRRLLLLAGETQKDIVEKNINNAFITNLAQGLGLTNTIATELKNLNGDFSNITEITDNIKTLIQNKIIALYNTIIENRAQILYDLSKNLYGVQIDFSEGNLAQDIHGNKLYLSRESLENLFEAKAQHNQSVHDVFVANGLDTDEKIRDYIIDSLNLHRNVSFKKPSVTQDDIDKLNNLLGTDYSKDTNFRRLSDEEKNAIEDVLNQDENKDLKEDFYKIDLNYVLSSEINGLKQDLRTLGLNEQAVNSLKSGKINLEQFISQSHLLKDEGKFKIHTLPDGRIDFAYYNVHYGDLFGEDNSIINAIFQNVDKDGNIDFDSIIQYINYDYNGNAISSFVDQVDDRGVPESVSASSLGEILNSKLDNIQSSMDALQNTVKDDKIHQYITIIKNAKETENPVINIVKKLAFSLNKNAENIEEFLDRLTKSINGEGFSKFILTPEDKMLLDESYDLLNLAKALIFAAYNSQNLENPFPHNELANQMIKKYGAKMNLLPVVDEDVAQLYLQQIASLMTEIGIQKDGEYNFGSLRYWDQLNTRNKALKFINAQLANYDAKAAFFIAQSQFGTFKSRNGSVDLLDGFQELYNQYGTNTELLVFKTENLIYNNFQKELQKHKGDASWNLGHLLDSLKIRESFFTNQHSFVEQETTELNEETKYTHWTPMTKFIYLMNTVGIRSDKFSNFQKQFSKNHSDLAALDIQQEVSRTGIVYQNNPILFRQMLDWAYKQYPVEGISDITPQIIYAAFVHGNGGAGKTEVVIRQQIEFAQAQGIESSQILLSGPTSEQIDKLKDLNVGKTQSIDDIIKNMLGKERYDKLQKDLTTTDASKWEILLPTYSSRDGKALVGKLDSKIKLNNIGCKLIVIDESTWIPTEIHSILSAYSQQYNIPLILVGDDYQSGYIDPNMQIGKNVNPTVTFMARTPRLALTLRDSNVQKWRNIPQLTTIIHALQTLPYDETARLQEARKILKDAQKMQLSYYIGEEINGDYVTDKLSESLIQKLKPSNKKQNFIGYVGSNQDTINALKKEYGDNAVKVFDQEQKIQGQEFDYVIIDSITDIPNLHNTVSPNINNALKFYKRIYTLSTRGKKAAIFIDSSKELAKQITFSEDKFKGEIANFKDSISQFNQKQDLLYSMFDQNPEEEEATIEIPLIPRFQLAINQTEEQPSIVEEYDENDIIQEEKQSETSQELSNLIQGDAQELEVPTHGFNEALVYGENTLSGMSFREDTHEGINKDGKTYTRTRRTYIAPQKDAVEISDCALYSELNGEEYAYDFSSRKHAITPLVKSLRELKDCILYNLPYVIVQQNELLKDSAHFLTEEDYNNILNGKNIYIECAPYNENTDNYVGLSQLSDDEKDMAIFDIDGQKYVLKVVAKWKISVDGELKGKTAKITLGLMNNPNLFEQRKENIREDLQNRINRLQVEQLTEQTRSRAVKIQQYEWYLQNLDNIVIDYKTQLRERIADPYRSFASNSSFKKDGYTFINGVLSFQPEVTYFDGNTVIRTTVRNHQNAVPRLRLSNEAFDGTDIDHAAFSFEDQNQDITISPVYIYKPESANMSGIAGKAVVFVTADPRYKNNSTSLINNWNQQATGKKAIRMLKLDVIGCSLTQLATPGIREIFRMQENDGSQVFNHTLPFVAYYMAVRQVISLWNFRANLNNFITALRTSKLNDISDDVLNDKLIQLHEDYQTRSDGKDNYTDQQFQTEYINDNPDDNLAKEIFNFNNTVSCRQFRLGIGNITGNNTKRNLYQIRQIILSDQNKDIYTPQEKEKYKDAFYGIYLTRDLAQKYQNIINEIFSLLQDSKIGLHVQKLDGGVYSDLSEHETIKKYKGLISNIALNTNESQYRMFTEMDNQKTFEQIPKIIVDITRKALAHSKLIRTGDGQLMLPNEGRYADRQVELIWNDNIMGKERIYQYKKEGVKYIHDDTEKVYIQTDSIYKHDLDVVDMLELCFHGTTDEFIEKRLKASKKKYPDKNYYNRSVTPQAMDADFKYGFFIDPMSNFSIRGENGIMQNFFEAINNKSQFTVQASIDRPTFRIGFVKQQIETEGENQQITSMDQITNPVDDFNNLPDIQEKIEHLQRFNDSNYEIFKEIFTIVDNANITDDNNNLKTLFNNLINSDTEISYIIEPSIGETAQFDFSLNGQDYHVIMSFNNGQNILQIDKVEKIDNNVDNDTTDNMKAKIDDIEQQYQDVVDNGIIESDQRLEDIFDKLRNGEITSASDLEQALNEIDISDLQDEQINTYQSLQDELMDLFNCK